LEVAVSARGEVERRKEAVVLVRGEDDGAAVAALGEGGVDGG
jgi:hypothetical protein